MMTQWMVDQAEADLDLKGNSSPVNSLDYKPSLKLLGSGSQDQTVIVQSPSSPAPLLTLTGHKSTVYEAQSK